jgi:hypothetical protein
MSHMCISRIDKDNLLDCARYEMFQKLVLPFYKQFKFQVTL